MDTVSSDNPVSQALRQFLNQRPDLFQGKRLLVFALSEPYALDATDISKLSAYYALYSRSSSFIEIAARILFHEVQPIGHLPVSVPGIGYEILEATSPDPNQTIHIYQEEQGAALGTGTQTPVPITTVLKIGDPIYVVSGLIVDHNGNPVPDGTIVRFTLYHAGDNIPAQIVEPTTTQGIARGKLLVDQIGEITIRADSGSATTSDVLTFEIPPENVTATPQVSTPSPTSSPSPTVRPTNTPTSTPQVTPMLVNPADQGNINFGDWLLALVVAAVVGGSNYWITNQKHGLRWGVRAALLPLIGGMLTYVYLAIKMPGSASVMRQMGNWAVFVFVLLGAGVGAGAMWLWQALELRSIKTA